MGTLDGDHVDHQPQIDTYIDRRLHGRQSDDTIHDSYVVAQSRKSTTPGIEIRSRSRIRTLHWTVVKTPIRPGSFNVY